MTFGEYRAQNNRSATGHKYFYALKILLTSTVTS